VINQPEAYYCESSTYVTSFAPLINPWGNNERRMKSNIQLKFITNARNNNGTTDDGLNWNKDSEAWPFHLVSTISEWVMAASFFCFLLTMWFDFSYLTLTVNCDRTNLNLDT